MTTTQTCVGERTDVTRTKPALLRLQLAALAQEAAAEALPASLIAAALDSGNREKLTNILRNVPVFEGRLLESGLRALAAHRPGRNLLPEGAKLPLSSEALKEARRTLGQPYRGRALKTEAGFAKTYVPDMILHDREQSVIHIVDIKRNLNSFETLRITDLRIRMRAAALVAGSYLQERHGCGAREIRTVIINASAVRSDYAAGIWCLDDLDHVVGLPGAGGLLREARDSFEETVDRNWQLALHRSRRGVQDAVLRPLEARVLADGLEPTDIRVGYAEIPPLAQS